MSMNVKSPFVLASLLTSLLPFYHASANEQARDEVRQALLSIQAELNQMEGRKAKKPPTQEAPFVSKPEPELLTPNQTNPQPEQEAELP
jgi:hypothetical protein